MLDEVIWTQFWIIQIWLMVLLLVYCNQDEVVCALGRDRGREMFFGAPSKTASGTGNESLATHESKRP
jgi:hypothetical protein